MIGEICAKCNVCTFRERFKDGGTLKAASYKYSRDTSLETPLVLVIADSLDEFEEEANMRTFTRLLETIPYTFTRVVRCEHKYPDLTNLEYKEAISRCSVWTHNLLNDRAVILTVLSGLEQMGIQGKKPGDVFRSAKYGVVVVLGSLDLLGLDEFSFYKPRVERALREASLI